MVWQRHHRHGYTPLNISVPSLGLYRSRSDLGACTGVVSTPSAGGAWEGASEGNGCCRGCYCIVLWYTQSRNDCLSIRGETAGKRIMTASHGEADFPSIACLLGVFELLIIQSLRKRWSVGHGTVENDK